MKVRHLKKRSRVPQWYKTCGWEILQMWDLRSGVKPEDVGELLTGKLGMLYGITIVSTNKR